MFSLNHSCAILILVSIDQISKYFAESFLSFYTAVSLSPWLSLVLAHNYGAAYGVFHGQRILLVTIAGAILLFGYLERHKLAPDRLSKWALTILFSGTIGNLADRMILGYVIDFIDIKHMPIFNLADIFINLGLTLFILDFFLKKHAVYSRKR